MEPFRNLKQYKKVCCIYRIHNLETKSDYIGATINLLKRVSNHRIRLLRYRHPNSRFQSEYNDHGFDVLRVEILRPMPLCIESIFESEYEFYEMYESTRINGNRPTRLTYLKQKPKVIDVTDSLKKSFFSCAITSEDPDACWGWRKGAKRNHGYPELRDMKAARISYAIFRGPPPGNLVACHTCDNKECTNPAHIYMGTRKQNAEDYSRSLRANKL